MKLHLHEEDANTEAADYEARLEWAVKATCAHDDLSARFDALKRYYKLATPAIARFPTYQWAFRCWEELGLRYLLSPIEAAVWDVIRLEGLVLYPQYPVAGYFVDFGHPVAKVAVECDGKQYHKDYQRDRERQSQIEAHGWTVYRLRGWECNAWGTEDEASPAESLLRQIGRDHRLSARLIREAA